MTHIVQRMHSWRRVPPVVAAILIINLNSAAAQQPADPSRPATPKIYAPGDVQTENSRVYIRVDKSGLGHLHGVVGVLKQGHVSLGATANAGVLEFDLASFVADVPYARKYLGVEGEVSASTQREVTENMLGPDVLNVKRYPAAQCRLDSILPASHAGPHGLTAYVVTGQFTLHDVTRPVKFEVEAEDHGPWIQLRGSFAFKQSSFGIKPMSKAFGMIAVADELTVVGDILIAAPPKP